MTPLSYSPVLPAAVQLLTDLGLGDGPKEAAPQLRLLERALEGGDKGA